MTVGLRERNKLRRSEQITQAALRLFAERGFDGATIDEIAAAADVSRRTFFRYFARKEDVILDWKRQMADELRDAIDARPPGTLLVWDRVGALFNSDAERKIPLAEIRAAGWRPLKTRWTHGAGEWEFFVSNDE